MENSYVNAVIGNTSDFCELFYNYENELKNLGEKCESISKEVEDYNNVVATNGNASEQSYDALPDDRKYHDESGQVIPYSDLSVSQKRGLAKEATFIADREIEFSDRIAEASYNMTQSARKFVKDLQDKMSEVRRSNNHLSQLNLQYVADIARNQNVIDDCLHDLPRATTVDEKRSITERRIQALKENRKTELSIRINMALINATNLIETVFNQVITNMESTIANEFENVDIYSAQVIEDKMDIMSDLTKLMASFTNIKNEYQSEKELITSINEKCIAMRKSTEDKDVRKFANEVMKTTKEFSKLIEEIEDYNKSQKNTQDAPSNDGPNPDGPNPDGPNPDGPNPDGPNPEGPNPDVPNPDGPNPDVPNPDGPNPDGPNPDGPNPDGPNPDGPNPDGPNPDGPNGPGGDGPEEPTRQNQDVEYKVNRRRQADAAKRNIAMTALGVGLVAANGLGLAPVASAVLSGGILAVAGAGVANGVLTAAKRKAATHKLKKVAKQMRKEGLNIRLGEFDYEKGIVEYMFHDNNNENGYDDGKGKDIPLREADQDPNLIHALQDKLDKTFRNKQRGLHEGADKTSKFEIDMQEMPKVTINNLEAAYAPIGGIRSFKDDVLGEAFSWDTNSSWLAKLKDAKFVRNIRDREEQTASDVSLDDIVEESNGPVVEEEADQEVTPETQEQDSPEVQTPEVQAPEAQTPEVQAPEVQTPEAQAPEVQTPETQAPEVQTPEAQAPVTPEPDAPAVQVPDMTGTNNGTNQNPTEENLFAELDNPSDMMNLNDDELAELLANLGNAESIEQGVEDLAQAAEEAPSRGL